MDKKDNVVFLKCHVQGCKDKPRRWGFCPEHFEQFKFGLVKKNGELVSDYDLKFESYLRHNKKAA